MQHKYREYILLFIIAFFQIGLTSINVYLVSRKSFLLIFVSSFLLSGMYCFTIKKIVLGTLLATFVYSLGAASGCVIGTILISLFIE